MKIFSFFSASSPRPLSTSSSSNDSLIPSRIQIPSLPSEELPSLTAPVIVFPSNS